MSDRQSSSGKWAKHSRYNIHKYDKYDKDDRNGNEDRNGKFDSRDNGWEEERDRNWRHRGTNRDGHRRDRCAGDREGRQVKDWEQDKEYGYDRRDRERDRDRRRDRDRDRDSGWQASRRDRDYPPTGSRGSTSSASQLRRDYEAAPSSQRPVHVQSPPPPGDFYDRPRDSSGSYSRQNHGYGQRKGRSPMQDREYAPRSNFVTNTNANAIVGTSTPRKWGESGRYPYEQSYQPPSTVSRATSVSRDYPPSPQHSHAPPAATSDTVPDLARPPASAYPSLPMSFAEYIPRTDDSLSDLPPQLEFSLQPLPDTPRPSAELQIRTSPVKISFGQPSVKTVKKGWKSISPKQKARVSLFDEDEEDIQGTKGEKEAIKETVPEKEQGTMGEALPHPDTLIHRLTLASTRYTTLLTSLSAPLRAAFDSFSTLPSSPPPPPIDLFLDEYLGRKARDDEVKRVEEVWEAKKEWEREEEMGRRYLEEVGKGGRVEGVNAVPAERGVVRTSPAVIAAPKPEPELEPEPQAPASGAESQPQSQVAIPLPAARTSVYQKLAPVGEGTYGKVYKALSLITHQPVALKRIRMENEKDGFPVTAMREIKLLQMLQHENVLRLMEMVVERGGVYMVLEYMEFDLTGLLAHPEIKFSPANIKSLSHQMLSGLSYLHHRSILHRDMKGSNILVNSRGELKLADFGLARVYAKKRREDYTNRVITLWYRSPELLMGETIYGPEVDMWSAGYVPSYCSPASLSSSLMSITLSLDVSSSSCTLRNPFSRVPMNSIS